MPQQPDPDREQRIAEGVGLIAAGHSVRHAGATVAIPYQTLYDRYVATLGPNAPDKDAARKRADEQLMATAYIVAQGCLDRMATELPHADHRTITAWAAVSAKVLERMRGWDGRGGEAAESAPRWVAAVDRILAGGGAQLTVTVARLADAEGCSEES